MYLHVYTHIKKKTTHHLKVNFEACINLKKNMHKHK